MRRVLLLLWSVFNLLFWQNEKYEEYHRRNGDSDDDPDFRLSENTPEKADEHAENGRYQREESAPPHTEDQVVMDIVRRCLLG